MINSSQDLFEMARQAAAKTGAELLGYQLWWELHNCSIDHASLMKLASKYGVNPEWIPSKPTNTSVFKRAMATINKYHLPRELELKRISRADDVQKIWVALVNNEIDEVNKDIEFRTVQKITFERSTECFEVDRSYGKVDLLGLFGEWYDYHTLMHTDDCRKIIAAFNIANSISLRSSGGIYFVPVAFQQQMEAVTNLLMEVSNANIIYQMPVTDIANTRQIMAERAELSITNEIEIVQRELERLINEDIGGEKSRLGKLPELMRLKAKAQTFADALNFKADGCLALIKKLEAAATGDDLAILRLKKAEDEAAAAPAAEAVVFDAVAGF